MNSKLIMHQNPTKTEEICISSFHVKLRKLFS